VIRIGCSGWNYQHWRGPVYPSSEPSRRWLDLYADWFDTVEVNATFYRLPDAVYDLLRAHDAALVVAVRAPAHPTPWIETAGWSYIRFHNGHARGGAYGRHALATWARRIADASGDVYAYFNNDWEAFAVANARTLQGILSSA
jgi:uncharacterized protein YecE (DUF72 family)